MARYYEGRKTKGHGCIGAFIAFLLVACIAVALLLFCTDKLDVYVDKLFDLNYPVKYSEHVEKYSKEFDVDENLIYAIIKCESGFKEDAVSSAGAMGLMQLMPDTFEWLQTKLHGEVTMSQDKLLDPETNIEYGTYLMKILLDDFNNDENTAVAAYNAGLNTVGEWLSNKDYSSDGVTLKKIPYPETEKYVEKVEKAQEKYIKINNSKKAEDKNNG